jgi:hypothetical protein
MASLELKAMGFRLVLTSPRATRGMAAQAVEARAAALQAVAEHWVKEMLPEHFKASAVAKYGYDPRTKPHMRRKRREGRGEDPNVYTGRLREKIMGTEPRVSVNRRGVTLVWPGLPRYTFVVDTMEFVGNERRFDDEAVQNTRAWMLKEAERAKDPAKARAEVEKRIAGIFAWRKQHPKDGKGKFAKVKRPDKVKEITAMNRTDADALGVVFKRVMEEKLGVPK